MSEFWTTLVYTRGMLKCVARYLTEPGGSQRYSMQCPMARLLQTNSAEAISQSIHLLNCFFAFGARLQAEILLVMWEGNDLLPYSMGNILRCVKEIFIPREEKWNLMNVDFGDCRMQVRETFVTPSSKRGRCDKSNIWKFLRTGLEWEEVLVRDKESIESIWECIEKEEEQKSKNNSFFWIDLWIEEANVTNELNQELGKCLVVTAQTAMIMLLCVSEDLDDLLKPGNVNMQKAKQELVHQVMQLKYVIEQSILTLALFIPDWMKDSNFEGINCVNGVYIGRSQQRYFKQVFDAWDCTRC